MTKEEFIKELEESFIEKSKMFSVGNNWVLGPTNKTAYYISQHVAEFLEEKEML